LLFGVNQNKQANPKTNYAERDGLITVYNSGESTNAKTKWLKSVAKLEFCNVVENIIYHLIGNLNWYIFSKVKLELDSDIFCMALIPSGLEKKKCKFHSTQNRQNYNKFN
jgi:hypothetical protein